MTRYFISFDHGAMDFPEEDFADVSDAAHAVIHAARDAGLYVTSGGLTDPEEMSAVGVDGFVSTGPLAKAHVGGFTILDVPSREVALEWAARIAVACRCSQEVREIMDDPQA